MMLRLTGIRCYTCKPTFNYHVLCFCLCGLIDEQCAFQFQTRLYALTWLICTHSPGWCGGIGTHSFIILWQGLRAIGAQYIWFRQVHYVLVLLGNTFSQIFFPYIAANLVNAVWNLCASVLNYQSPNSHRTFNVIIFIERPEWVMQITHAS